jgi:hypothetical protein
VVDFGGEVEQPAEDGGVGLTPFGVEFSFVAALNTGKLPRSSDVAPEDDTMCPGRWELTDAVA